MTLRQKLASTSASKTGQVFASNFEFMGESSGLAKIAFSRCVDIRTVQPVRFHPLVDSLYIK